MAFIINVILSVIIVVLERKQPEKTIAWLLILTLLPPIGLILYIFLGRNWKRHKLNDRINPKINDLISPILDEYTEKQYVPLMELLAFNSDSPIFVNNDIKIYKDGIEKFKDLKEELLKAKHHIHLEYYIVNSDEIGNEIKDILIKKALEGVKVRFIIDKVGSSSLKRSYIKELKKAGVSVVMYSYFLAPLLKVINNKIGYVGGFNVGDEYLGRNKKFGYWRDTHLMIKGDFVLALQAVFLDDFITIEKANNSYTFYDKEFDKYFPESTVAKEKVLMQLVKSGPDSTFPAIMQSILKMIMTARENIYITTPYFVPPSSIIEALRIASLSGVDVKIIFPEKSDHFMVNKASKSYLAELMDCGIEVYFYDKSSFIHSKTMTIDGKICTLGTANMDIRSFELNYEINTVIYDKEITCKLDALFFEDLLKCRHFKIEEYEKSTKFDKFIEGVTRIFSALL